MIEFLLGLVCGVCCGAVLVAVLRDSAKQEAWEPWVEWRE